MFFWRDMPSNKNLFELFHTIAIYKSTTQANSKFTRSQGVEAHAQSKKERPRISQAFQLLLFLYYFKYGRIL